MTRLDTLFFDVGGVCLTNGWDTDARLAAASHFILDVEETEERHQALADCFERGELSLDAYLDHVVFHRERTFSRDAFVAFMRSRSQPHRASLTVISGLASGGLYRMATINNESRELNRYRIDTFGHVRTSPLQRARRTCELAGLGDAAHSDPDLAEWDYGTYEGRTTADIRRERPGWSLLRDGAPGGESTDQVSGRVDRCTGALVLGMASPPRDTLQVRDVRAVQLVVPVAHDAGLARASWFSTSRRPDWIRR
jgi:hypothetical protein